MFISTKGRYALRLMLGLAKAGGEEQPVPLKKVAESQNISLKYLEQIIPALSRAGFVKSMRGSQGGYRLTRAPKDYTIGMILRLTEGTLAPVSCLEDEKNLCPRAEFCETLFVWEKLYAAITDTADGITLQDVLDRSEGNANGDDYCI